MVVRLQKGVPIIQRGKQRKKEGMLHHPGREAGLGIGKDSFRRGGVRQDQAEKTGGAT